MNRTCDVCSKQYEYKDSEATYGYIFCSQECEDKSYDVFLVDENEPGEYLKDDMSNL